MKWTVQTVVAALIGAAVIAVIDLGVWALAYYGHIDLHLPQSQSSLDFVTIDNYIERNLPPHYEYSVEALRNFRGTGNETLVVTANQINNYTSLFLKGPGNGVIMLLDKNSSGVYQVDYKFEPKMETRQHLRVSDASPGRQ